MRGEKPRVLEFGLDLSLDMRDAVLEAHDSNLEVLVASMGDDPGISPAVWVDGPLIKHSNAISNTQNFAACHSSDDICL
jgi:hypothetical protein